MIDTERVLPNLKRPPDQRLRLYGFGEIPVCHRQIRQVRRELQAVWAQRLLVDCQDLFQQWLAFGVAPLRLVKIGQLFQGCREARAFGFFESGPEMLFRFGIVALKIGFSAELAGLFPQILRA